MIQRTFSRQNRKKKILVLITGYFNFQLNDGGTLSLVSLLGRLGKDGFRVGLACLTDANFARGLLSLKADRSNYDIIFKNNERIACRLKDFPFPMHFHPRNIGLVEAYRRKDPKRLAQIVGLWRPILAREKPDITLTTEEDVFAMSACLKHAPFRLHRISSPKLFDKDGVTYPDLFRKLAPRFKFICGGGFLNDKLLSEYGRKSFDLPPLIDFGRYRAKKRAARNSGYITLINGAWHKGLLVFLSLAKNLPQRRFLVRGRKDVIDPLLKENGLSNVIVEQKAAGINSVYRRTSILLAPSLCDEAFSRVIIEAMVNGIPVIANDMGGIRNTLNGAGFLAEVNLRMKKRPDFLVNPYYHFSLVEQYLAHIAFLDDPDNYAEAAKRSREAAGTYEIESEKRYQEFVKWLKLESS